MTENKAKYEYASSKSRATATVLALTLGLFGAHNFYTGNKKTGGTRLLFTFLGSLLTVAGLITYLYLNEVGVGGGMLFFEGCALLIYSSTMSLLEAVRVSKGMYNDGETKLITEWYPEADSQETETYEAVANDQVSEKNRVAGALFSWLLPFGIGNLYAKRFEAAVMKLWFFILSLFTGGMLIYFTDFEYLMENIEYDGVFASIISLPGEYGLLYQGAVIFLLALIAFNLVASLVDGIQIMTGNYYDGDGKKILNWT